MSGIERDFYVFGDFDESLLNRVGSELLGWVYKAPDRGRVNIFIDSGGGDMSVLRTMLSAIGVAKNRGLRVSTFVTGNAYSCGSMLAIAGTPGFRFMSPYGQHMIHYGQSSSRVESPLQLDREAVQSKRHFEFVVDHYKSNSSIKGLRKKLVADSLYVGVDQALRWGLADREMF